MRISWIDTRIERLETQKMADGIILVCGFDRHQREIRFRTAKESQIATVVGDDLARKIVAFHEDNPNTGTCSPRGQFRVE